MNKHNSIKIPVGFFWYADELILNYIWKYKGLGNCQNNFEKEDEVGGFTVLSVK